jgi:catechol-2,3-dioxygenase
MPKPSKFAHVVYRTRRYEEMLRWYQTVFEAKVQHQDPALAFLTYDDEHHRFAIANLSVLEPGSTETEKQGSVGVDHVAYTFPTVADLLQHYERLRGAGITPYWCIHHGPTVSMYYADPDLNQMEFQVECFDDVKAANRYVRSNVFAANPIGIEFDPEELLRRYRDGASAEELLARPEGPNSPLRRAVRA